MYDTLVEKADSIRWLLTVWIYFLRQFLSFPKYIYWEFRANFNKLLVDIPNHSIDLVRVPIEQFILSLHHFFQYWTALDVLCVFHPGHCGRGCGRNDPGHWSVYLLHSILLVDSDHTFSMIFYLYIVIHSLLWNPKFLFYGFELIKTNLFQHVVFVELTIPRARKKNHIGTTGYSIN